MPLLRFEGVFRDSYIFLNGKQLFYHDCGYTSFSVRIDNATNVVNGGKNVLAVFVDPNSGKSGWWCERWHVRLWFSNPDC